MNLTEHREVQALKTQVLDLERRVKEATTALMAAPDGRLEGPLTHRQQKDLLAANAKAHAILIEGEHPPSWSGDQEPWKTPGGLQEGPVKFDHARLAAVDFAAIEARVMAAMTPEQLATFDARMATMVSSYGTGRLPPEKPVWGNTRRLGVSGRPGGTWGDTREFGWDVT